MGIEYIPFTVFLASKNHTVHVPMVHCGLHYTKGVNIRKRNKNLPHTNKPILFPTDKGQSSYNHNGNADDILNG